MPANAVTHFPHFIALKWILLHNVSNSINGQLLEWGLTNLHMVNPLSKHLVIHVIRICHHYNDVLREGVGGGWSEGIVLSMSIQHWLGSFALTFDLFGQ